MSTIPFSAPSRHVRWWWAFVPTLVAVVGLVAAGASVQTLGLGALVLGATVLRLVVRPRLARGRP